jgi:hypothetical protein
MKPWYNKDGQLLASHRGGLGFISGQVMWDLLWIKWQWSSSRFIDHPVIDMINFDTDSIIK